MFWAKIQFSKVLFFFLTQTVFSGSAFGGHIVGEVKPALSLGLMSLLSPKPSNMGLLMNYQLSFNVRCPPGSPQ